MEAARQDRQSEDRQQQTRLVERLMGTGGQSFSDEHPPADGGEGGEYRQHDQRWNNTAKGAVMRRVRFGWLTT